MKKADQWTGLALLILSIVICWGSYRLHYGNIHEPGPGFFPLWLGILLGAMSIGLILKTTRQKQGARMVREVLSEKMRWGKVLSALIALFLYGCLMNFLGFLIVSFLFMFFLLWFFEPKAWKTVIGWALVGSLGPYLVFEVWLKLRLPKGIFGV